MAEKHEANAVVASPSPTPSQTEAGDVIDISAGSAHLKRSLTASQVQLYGIGAAIGTGVFVTMGSNLPNGGPGGLFLGFFVWAVFVYGINDCYGKSHRYHVEVLRTRRLSTNHSQGEMVSYAPVPAPFMRFAGAWVDDALGFAISWAFYFNQIFLLPFEMTAFQRLITFWTDKLPVAATTFILIVCYGLLNLVSVKWFGRAEFYLSILKVFLIFLTFGFTIVTMLGGNPLHDRFGFRYWRTPVSSSRFCLGQRTIH